MKRSVKKPSTLRRVLRYVGRYPFSLAGTVLFAIINVTATLFIPVLFGDGIDCIIEKGVLWTELKTIFWKIGAAAGIAAIAGWLLALCNNRISANVVRDLRKDAFYKIGNLPLQYIDTHPHGDTVSRVVADADQFSDGLLMGYTWDDCVYAYYKPQNRGGRRACYPHFSLRCEICGYPYAQVF